MFCDRGIEISRMSQQLGCHHSWRSSFGPIILKCKILSVSCLSYKCPASGHWAPPPPLPRSSLQLRPDQSLLTRVTRLFPVTMTALHVVVSGGGVGVGGRGHVRHYTELATPHSCYTCQPGASRMPRKICCIQHCVYAKYCCFVCLCHCIALLAVQILNSCTRIEADWKGLQAGASQNVRNMFSTSTKK